MSKDIFCVKKGDERRVQQSELEVARRRVERDVVLPDQEMLPKIAPLTHETTIFVCVFRLQNCRKVHIYICMLFYLSSSVRIQ